MKTLLSVLIAAFFATASVGVMAASHGGAMKDADCKMDEKKMDDKTKMACKKMMDEKKAPEMKKEEPKK
jgi:hypothetical protein